MNQRQAKREACRIAGEILESFAESGSWAANHPEPGVCDDHFPVADQRRIEDALVDLAEEMHRRGERAPSTAAESTQERNG